ncbi:AAA family ATPase [Psychromonas ossibalaenae]|uniref:AAA family ATPase n=1 Tax=Psychromonas ossibalaenae TaxID=444922 RepID=UPI00036F668D|nr:AAA family ATPase [Psychromonas ossibalaenae]
MRLPRRSELSEQQEDFLMEAPFDRPVLCVGPPGTGKTVLALYRGAMLNQKGDNVDFIMHSKLLNRYVARSVEELDMDFDSRTWHSWIYSLWRKGNGRSKLPELEKYLPDFIKAISFVKEGKVSKLKNMYWEHLIIDEGQDFPKEFYLFLTVLRHEESILAGRQTPVITIFADENQRMEESRNSTIRDIQNNVPDIIKYEVTVNYRNSGPIANLASYFYVGMSTGIPDTHKNLKGLMPQLRRFDTLEDELQSVVNWLNNNDDLSVGIIVPDRTVQTRIVNTINPLAAKRKFKVQKYSSGTDADTIDFYTNRTITVVCDKSCKGLEFDSVFIPQLQCYKTDGANEDFFKMKMYVMVSRARSYLQFSYSVCTENPQVLKMLPTPEEEVLKWRI